MTEQILTRQPQREPIRHLLVGSPTLVQHTIHQLHNLRYAEAGLWSPEINLTSAETVLTLNPGEILRILLRYGASPTASNSYTPRFTPRSQTLPGNAASKARRENQGKPAQSSLKGNYSGLG